MPDNYTFEAESLQLLARDLRDSAARLRHELTPTLLQVGEDVKQAAKAEAERHSSKIPPTVKVRAVPGAVEVHAGGQDVALAALYELGNRGRGGRRKDTFSHPVFGNSAVWVTQPRYPFLRPALTLLRRQVTKRMEQAWEKALEPMRLR